MSPLVVVVSGAALVQFNRRLHTLICGSCYASRSCEHVLSVSAWWDDMRLNLGLLLFVYGCVSSFFFFGNHTIAL
jgi:hypothetical protein